MNLIIDFVSNLKEAFDIPETGKYHKILSAVVAMNGSTSVLMETFHKNFWCIRNGFRWKTNAYIATWTSSLTQIRSVFTGTPTWRPVCHRPTLGMPLRCRNHPWAGHIRIRCFRYCHMASNVSLSDSWYPPPPCRCRPWTRYWRRKYAFVLFTQDPFWIPREVFMECFQWDRGVTV